MSRIKTALQGKKSFIGFLTAGDPSLEKTEEYILTMAQAGADLIEIGIPFSDPIAEGRVIEAANMRALASGTTLEKVFEMVARVRAVTKIPLVFLTYINPVFSYGYARFFQRCEALQIDGIILPDLPFEEQQELRPLAEECGVDVISLVAPTSEKRALEIAKNAKGFLYLVSSLGVTGVRSEIKTNLQAVIETIKSVTDIPVCVGFGISTPEQAKDIWRYADGVIVGSALVKLVEQHGGEASEALEEYVKSMVCQKPK